ncbi:MAG TPA: transposase [Candidatus Babeliaceae bacterium]|nr:transposase [Candidatus Babeliaceae bacterium]
MLHNCCKRNGSNNTKEVIYIVSNVKRTAREHIAAYKQRWPVEKFYRTSKQHLGLTNCQSTDAEKQRLHVFMVMVSYASLELMRIDQKKTSVEEVLHPLRRQKKLPEVLESLDFIATFMT